MPSLCGPLGVVISEHLLTLTSPGIVIQLFGVMCCPTEQEGKSLVLGSAAEP